MNPEIIIVPMRAEHVNQVCDIESASFGRGSGKSYEVWSKQIYLGDLKEGNYIYVCAMLGQEVTGYCGMMMVAGEGHITKIAVKSSYRQQGVGSLILSYMLEYGKKNNLTYYVLEVRKSNIAAQKLYEKYGFTLAGTRIRYYSDNGEDAFIYVREEYPC